MKKILMLLIVMAAAVAMLTVKGTMASGDKVRGDNAEGSANQVQNVDCQAWDEWCID